MKVKFALIFAFAALVSCDHQSDSKSVTEGQLTDDEAISLINDNMFAGEEEKYKDNEFAKFIVNKINQTCVLNHLKKHNAVEQILRPSHEAEDSSRLLILLLSTMCLKNLDALLDYTFENYMTFNILYRAFIDEPELKEYSDNFKCFNAYAIEHKIFDAQMYKLNTDVIEVELCEKRKEIVRENIDHLFIGKFFKSFNFKNIKCFQEVVPRVENSILRSILLIQTELTASQRILEKSKFIETVHSLTESLSICGMTPKA